MKHAWRVLFICVHNSGRSQMAAAYLRHFAGAAAEVTSAGLEPAAAVNPLVVEAMHEEGFDLSRQVPQSVFELFTQGRLFDLVITVCDGAAERRCPVYPGITQRLHWPFPDPARVSGSRAQQLSQVRAIRDQIKHRILDSQELRPLLQR
jgi:arsenate reductase